MTVRRLKRPVERNVVARELEFIKGVDKLHAFYTEHVRMLAHAYDLTDEEAARVLDRFDFKNVARSILHPPRVDLFEAPPEL